MKADFDTQRHTMVDEQIAARGIHDKRVLDAMRAVPRHLFVPEAVRVAAYRDGPLSIGSGQTISQPYIVALMAELANVRSTDSVLDVGTGSGYGAAVLAWLADKVISLERHDELATLAHTRLHRLGIRNVEVHTTDGTKGWPTGSPFDAIVAAAGAEHVPNALKDQLAVGGRLVIPVGKHDLQKMRLIRRTSEREFSEADWCEVAFVPLVGAEKS